VLATERNDTVVLSILDPDTGTRSTFARRAAN
jgi:hypothetical protein